MDCTLCLQQHDFQVITCEDVLPMRPKTVLMGKSLDSENISRTVSLIENGWYSFACLLQRLEEDIIEAEVFLNGEVIAVSSGIMDCEEGLKIAFQFTANNKEVSQPFLLIYDIAQLEVCVRTSEGDPISYSSAYLVCLSADKVDSENVRGMIKELIDFEDQTINEWMFHSASQTRDSYGMIQGSFCDHAYKSLNTYVQIVEEICLCYSHNLGYYRTQPHSVLKQFQTLLPYEKIRKLTTGSVVWLAHNLEQLHEVDTSCIAINNQAYLPNRMLSSETKKSLNTYENQVVVAFLRMIYTKNKSVISSFETHIRKETEFIDSIKAMEKGDLRAPIITVKEINLEDTSASIRALNTTNEKLGELLAAYTAALPCDNVSFNKIPRKTKVFQEIRTYARVYEQIIRWIRFGEFSFERENLIINIRKIDKLFEYYCLYRLLNMFKSNGYRTYSELSIYSHAYQLPALAYYQNETTVANTYTLTDGMSIVTLYYLPVIHTARLENGIRLFRALSGDRAFSYYSPDYLIKIERLSGKEKYIILDAKYSSHNSIEKNYMSMEIHKYVNCLAHVDNSYRSIVMMWLLQGRVDLYKAGWSYLTSSMAKKYKPIPSFGIFPINAYSEDLSGLWEEMKDVTQNHDPDDYGTSYSYN